MIINSNKNSKLIGYNKIFLEMKNLFDNNLLPNKIIFSGNNGIGKCTFAYHFINWVHSSSEANPYDLTNFEINSENKSFQLTQNKSNPNFELIDIYVNGIINAIAFILLSISLFDRFTGRK